MSNRLVIFDMDGTVLDTLDDLLTAMNHALGKNGYPLHTREEMKTFVGNGLYKMVVRALPEGTSEAVTDRVFVDFKGYYADHLNVDTKPYTGIKAILEALKANGIAAGISSNKFDPGAKALAETHFGPLIGLTVGESETVPKKPDPTGTRMLMEYFGADEKSTLYVGDSGVDLATAKNAGLNCVCVSWGFTPRPELIRLGADRIVDTPQALLQAICSFFGKDET